MSNIIEIIDRINLIKGLYETLYMVGFSTVFSYMIGLPIGVIVVVTDKSGLKPNKIINSVLGWVINMGRSIPFIILLVLLIPFTIWIVGTSVGPTAVIVPLTIGAVPFVARVVEAAIKNIDKGVVEASVCMGASIKDIIFRVYLVETIPSIIRGISLTAIMLVGYSAMAGAVGGGGLGDIAIRYGYYRFDTTTMIITLIVLIILVQIIQIVFELVARTINKK